MYATLAVYRRECRLNKNVLIYIFWMLLKICFKHWIDVILYKEGNMGNCNPEKSNVDRGETEVDIGFRVVITAV